MWLTQCQCRQCRSSEQTCGGDELAVQASEAEYSEKSMSSHCNLLGRTRSQTAPRHLVSHFRFSHLNEHVGRDRDVAGRRPDEQHREEEALALQRLEVDSIPDLQEARDVVHEDLYLGWFQQKITITYEHPSATYSANMSMYTSAAW